MFYVLGIKFHIFLKHQIHTFLLKKTDMIVSHGQYIGSTIRESVLNFDYHIFWSIAHIYCMSNETIDILAKIGTNGSTFIEFV